MRQGIDDSAALDAFMNAYRYAAGEGLVVKNLPDHPIHARAHRGNTGAYFDFGKLHALEAHISELPPGQATKMHHHTCEALFYVLTGRGYSIIQEEDEPDKQVEWAAGDLFSRRCLPGISTSMWTQTSPSVTSKSQRCAS